MSRIQSSRCIDSGMDDIINALLYFEIGYNLGQPDCLPHLNSSSRREFIGAVYNRARPGSIDPHNALRSIPQHRHSCKMRKTKFLLLVAVVLAQVAVVAVGGRQ